jgi:hypothetical protein
LVFAGSRVKVIAGIAQSKSSFVQMKIKGKEKRLSITYKILFLFTMVLHSLLPITITKWDAFIFLS